MALGHVGAGGVAPNDQLSESESSTPKSGRFDEMTVETCEQSIKATGGGNEPVHANAEADASLSNHKVTWNSRKWFKAAAVGFLGGLGLAAYGIATIATGGLAGLAIGALVIGSLCLFGGVGSTWKGCQAYLEQLPRRFAARIIGDDGEFDRRQAEKCLRELQWCKRLMPEEQIRRMDDSLRNLPRPVKTTDVLEIKPTGNFRMPPPSDEVWILDINRYKKMSYNPEHCTKKEFDTLCHAIHRTIDPNYREQPDQPPVELTTTQLRRAAVITIWSGEQGGECTAQDVSTMIMECQLREPERSRLKLDHSDRREWFKTMVLPEKPGTLRDIISETHHKGAITWRTRPGIQRILSSDL